MLNEQYKAGDQVTLNTDNWSDVGRSATVIEQRGFQIIVEDESGITRTVSVHQVQPKSFLAE